MARRKSVTLRDIADRVGVSVTAVSAVVNNRRNGAHVGEGTRSAILDTARRLGYQSHSPLVDASSAAVVNATVAILCLPWYDPLFGKTVSELCRACTEWGMHPFIHVAPDGVSACRTGSQLCEEGRAHALVFLGSRSHPEEVAVGDVPCVVIGEVPDGTGMMQVCTHNAHGGRLVGEHLWGLGHRRIGVLTVPGAPFAARRLAGIRSVWEAHGEVLRDGWAQGLWPDRIDEAAIVAYLQCYTRDNGALPTAIFCTGDTIAAPIVNGLRHLGVNVPGEISVVGFDDHPILAERSVPPLTTVRTPFVQLGHVAAQLLLERLERGPGAVRSILLPGELMVRGSTAPVPTHPAGAPANVRPSPNGAGNAASGTVSPRMAPWQDTNGGKTHD
jgi:DNA-binding LacI/PurR family transcriptional regulator